MESIIKRISISVFTAVVAVGLSGGGVIFAQEQSASVPNQMMTANLSQLNDSGVTGTTSVQLLDGNQIKVTVNITGASPGLPHAQHLHIGGANQCPDPRADTDGDGFISTVEGIPSYGEVKVALTTEGDTSADSGLAVERFPVADSDGTLKYERTFVLPEGVSREDATKAVYVQHGISGLFNDKTKYDGEKKSTLDESLPFEATVPASCGKLVAAPMNEDASTANNSSNTAPDSATASETDSNNVPIIAAGVIAVIVAGTLLYLYRHKREV